RPEDLPAVLAAIAAAPDADVVDSSGKTARFTSLLGSPFLADLARMSEVESLIPYTEPKLYCDFGRRLIGIQTINQPAPESPAAPGEAPPGERWTGEGEVVGLLDSGLDATHPDFAGRVLEAVSYRGCPIDDGIGHGTHVAGIITGTGASSAGRIRGVAPGARLVVVAMVGADRTLKLPIDLGDLLSEATRRGAKIVNISWGSPLGGAYESGSASVDRFVRTNPDVLVVIAAGNEGTAPNGTFGFKSVGAPASAKNALTVGACASDRTGIDLTWSAFRPASFGQPPASMERVAGDPDLPAAISSRGPTDFDGVKPDLLAPGTFILAPRAARIDPKLCWKDDDEDSRYVFIGGTSMAAPIVAGAAAVLRGYLREQLGIASPSAALLKGLLLTATRRLPSRRPEMNALIGYPDFDQGFGRLDLAAILPHAGAPVKRKIVFADVPNESAGALESRMPPGAARKSIRAYKVTVAAGATEPLIATLAWTDLPGNDIQNNLQIDARTPDGSALVGNPEHHFRRDPLFDDLNLNGVPYDKRNSIEQVRFPAPVPGDYVFRVIAQNTLSPQGYALCVCGELDSALVEST
ncbi:MAG TPA: S8 family serine peptidase, partial [Solirubrobacterales bacterium]|nr:S8 family serine peptidase [Solirubrobacterales bacterium]